MKKAIFTRTIQLAGLCFMLSGMLFTLTCDNSPFVAGLGPKVDILAPVIHEIIPLSGEYLKESVFRFQARVTDDIGVKKVELYYQYNKTNDKTTGWKMVEMTQVGLDQPDWWEADIDSGILEYKEAKRNKQAFSKDTWIDDRPINDNSPFYIYIKAYDEESTRAPDKRPPTESDPNSYKIKMGPPVIALNSPDLKENFWLTTPHDSENYQWDEAHPKPVV